MFAITKIPFGDTVLPIMFVAFGKNFLRIVIITVFNFYSPTPRNAVCGRHFCQRITEWQVDWSSAWMDYFDEFGSQPSNPPGNGSKSVLVGRKTMPSGVSRMRSLG